MKYLKTFEGRFKGLDKQEIEDNIEGILVDLYDDGLEVAIDWLGGGLPNPVGLEIHIADTYNSRTDLRRKEFFISEDYIQRFLTAVDYLKKQWGDVSVKYEVYNENTQMGASFEDSTNLNYLGNLQKATEFQITVKKVNSTPKKLNERLGIVQGIEQQVEYYIKTIESKPIAKVFNLVYSCDLGTYKFKLIIDPKIDCRGYFNDDTHGNFSIYLADRSDEETLLHEVKHLDFNLRNKGKTKTPYSRSEKIISIEGKNAKVSKRTLELLEHIFYIYDENEFQSKYHSFYKKFDILMSELKVEADKIDQKITTAAVRHIFYNERWWDDSAFTWYVPKEGYDFKFENFVDKGELRIVFYYLLMEQKRKQYSNPYLDFVSYLIHGIKSDLKKTFKIFTGDEKKEIEKYITFFEKDINKKIKIYKKRMSRIVTLACEKYVK
jgi:hypothetical protein